MALQIIEDPLLASVEAHLPNVRGKGRKTTANPAGHPSDGAAFLSE
jgi:hypothetical protein